MTIQYKTIEQRVELFRAFHCRKNKRPLLGFSIGGEYAMPRYPFSARLPEDRALTPADFNIAGYVEDSEHLFLIHEQLGGDFIFSGSAFWGIPWLEAMLGCPLYASHLTGSIRAEPPKEFSTDHIPAFSPNNPWVQLMGQMLDALTQRAAGRFPLATTRMRGISDLLSVLYGGIEFVYEMYNNPDGIRNVAERLTDLFISCGKFQLDRIPVFHDGVGSFFYNAWVPRGTVWHQEDAAALLSPELYKDFIEPCNRRIVASFPHVVIHQHSTGFVPTNAYLDMGMTALEMHIDSGGPSAETLFERHLVILRERPLIICGIISEIDLDWIFSKLPVSGLAVITIVDTPETADRLWKKYIEKYF